MAMEWGETLLTLNFTMSIIKGTLYGITEFPYWLSCSPFW